MPEAKQMEQEKQRFDDIFFAMTSFVILCQKSEKIKLLGEEKYLKAGK